MENQFACVSKSHFLEKVLCTGGSHVHFLRDCRKYADVPGALEHAFEERLAAHNDPSSRVPTVVFINSAEGDVAPAQEGQPALSALGTLFATQADAALSAARLIWPSWE